MPRSSQSADRLSGPSRKIIGLGIFVVLAVIGYTLLWFYLADQLRGRVEAFLAGLEGRDIVASCEALDVRGYPFRIGVFCDSVSAETLAGEPVSFASAAFRSAAQVYAPGHIVSEIDGPVTVGLSEGEPVLADWTSLQASTVFSTAGLNRASLETRDLNASWEAGIGPVAINAASLAFHTRENGPDAEIALSADDARFEGAALPAGLPLFDLTGAARLTDGAGFLAGETLSREALRGRRGHLTDAAVTLEDGAALRLNGPFEIADDGEISGEFDVSIRDLERWTATAGDLVPQLRSTLESAGGMLRALGGSDGVIDVTLNVDGGRVSLGFIPLGRIPPI